MKKIILLFVLTGSAGYLPAQDNEIEKTIRALEQREVKAVLEKDSITLLKL